jgi:hypothetical protein
VNISYARVVLKGTKYIANAETGLGIVFKDATENGVVLTVKDATVFVPEDELMAIAMRLLDAKKSADEDQSEDDCAGNG